MWYQEKAYQKFAELLRKPENSELLIYVNKLMRKHIWCKSDVCKEFVTNARKSSIRRKFSDLDELIRLAKIQLESAEVNEQKRCTVCGQLIAEGEEIEVTNGDYICNHCTQSNVVTFCDQCQVYYFTEDGTEYNGENYCSDCANEYLTICEHCGDTQLISDCYFAEDTQEYYCENCRRNGVIAFCDHCQNWSAHYHSSDCIAVCDDCYNSYYITCEDCGEIIPYDESFEHNNYYYCENCYNNLDIEPEAEIRYPSPGEQFGGVRSYHSSMNLNFNHTPSEVNQRKRLYMGFELEAGKLPDKHTANEVATEVKSICNQDKCYLDCQHDGSIDLYGFETISHPCTLDYHKSFEPLKKALSYMVSSGMQSHYTENCGLHIHASRNYLTRSKWAEVDYFLHKFKTQFEKLARRNGNGFASFDYGILDTSKEIQKLKKAGKSPNRYRVLNFTNPSTVEFRLFKGTLKYETLLATLELVHATIMFIKKINAVQILNMRNFATFTEFVKTNKKQYNNLITYLENKGF